MGDLNDMTRIAFRQSGGSEISISETQATTPFTEAKAMTLLSVAMGTTTWMERGLQTPMLSYRGRKASISSMILGFLLPKTRG